VVYYTSLCIVLYSLFVLLCIVLRICTHRSYILRIALCLYFIIFCMCKLALHVLRKCILYGHVHLIIYRVFWCVCHVCCMMKHLTFALSGSGYCHIKGVVICLQYANKTTRSHTDVARFGLGFKPETRHNKS
jgi:hypothetical protein